MRPLSPNSHGEAVALFRYGLIAELVMRDLDHGALATELRRRAEERVRPPDSPCTRTYSVPTLERWLYAYKRGGLPALVPAGRSDRGRGRDLTAELRQLLCDIRREYPDASTTLILRTLRAEGRIGADVREGTVRRMLNEAGLARAQAKDRPGATTRLRWQADAPGVLWHGDVCHGPTLIVGEHHIPVRVHALLDDCARYIIALRVASDEKEETMLGLFVSAVLEHGLPDGLYLDNGSTYRGDILRLACARLGVTLLHARPYDAPARGKMERFWRTLREGALDHIGQGATLADVEAALRRWLDQHYHCSPHAGLLGRSPLAVYAPSTRPAPSLDLAKLRQALTVKSTRRVRQDCTIAVGGVDYEIPLGYLAGKIVEVATCFVDGAAPELVLEDRRIPLSPVDPVANSKRRRPPRRPAPEEGERTPVDFDPVRVLGAGVAPRLAAVRRAKGGKGGRHA